MTTDPAPSVPPWPCTAPVAISPSDREPRSRSSYEGGRCQGKAWGPTHRNALCPEHGGPDAPAPSVPPVPDGLADRLHEAARRAANALTHSIPCSMVRAATVEHCGCDLAGRRRRAAVDAVLADPAVAAALASPPAAPTGEPVRRMCEACIRACSHDYAPCPFCEPCPHLAPAPSGETQHAGWCRKSDTGMPDDLCGKCSPAPSGETAERAKALLAGVIFREWGDNYLRERECERFAADLAAALASAGLLSSPAQTPEPDAARDALALAVLARERLLARLHDFPVINLAREDGYGDLADTLTAALGPVFKYAARALAASLAQTDGPAVHWAALREELWSPWCSGTAGWDAPLTVTASQVTCPACRAGLVPGERSPVPAQTDGARE